jgi:hypothetical protein
MPFKREMERNVVKLSELVRMPDLCSPARADFSSALEENIYRALRMLKASHMFSRLLHDVKDSGLMIAMDDYLASDEYYFYPKAMRLAVGYQNEVMRHQEKSILNTMMHLTMGLRHAYHAIEQSWHDADIRPHDYMRVKRAEAADSEAFMIFIAFEMKMAGITAPWRALLNSYISDMALVFEQTICRDPVSGFDGRAMKAAYDQWFLDKARVADCDYKALERYDMALVQEEDHDLIARRVLKYEDYARLGQLPSGFNYLHGGSFSTLWFEGSLTADNSLYLKHIMKDVAHLRQKQTAFRR